MLGSVRQQQRVPPFAHAEACRENEEKILSQGSSKRDWEENGGEDVGPHFLPP